MYFTIITQRKNYHKHCYCFLTHSLSTLALLLKQSRAAIVVSFRNAASAPATFLLLMGELVLGRVTLRREWGVAYSPPVCAPVAGMGQSQVNIAAMKQKKNS